LSEEITSYKERQAIKNDGLSVSAAPAENEVQKDEPAEEKDRDDGEKPQDAE